VKAKEGEDEHSKENDEDDERRTTNDERRTTNERARDERGEEKQRRTRECKRTHNRDDEDDTRTMDRSKTRKETNDVDERDIETMARDIRTKTTSLRKLQEEITAQLSGARLSDASDESEDDGRESASSNSASRDKDEYYEVTDESALNRRAHAIFEGVDVRVSESLIISDVDRRASTSTSSEGSSRRISVTADSSEEVKLRRLDLRRVDLELKLENSWEKVELARRALEEAEEIHRLYASEFAVATKEFEIQQDLVYDERERKKDEAKAKQIAASQAAALKRADEHRREADASFKRGDIGAAEQLYSHAIAELEVSGIVLVQPSQLWLRVNRAAALFSLGHAREALMECELVLAVDCNHVRALLRASACCLQLRELEKAQRYIEFVALSSASSAADLREAAAQKCSVVRAFVERDKVAGNDAFRKGDFNAALQSYTSALEHLDIMSLPDSKNVQVGLFSNRAAAHMMLGNPKLAAEDCYSALKLDPLHFKAQVRLARCFLQLGHFEEAHREALDIIDHTSSNPDHKTDSRQVLDDLEVTRRIIDDAAIHLRDLQENENADVEKRSEKILQSLERALQLAPRSSLIATLKAEALRFVGDIDAAVELVEDVNVKDIRRLCVRARVYFDLADLRNCLESLNPLIPALEFSEGQCCGSSEAELNDTLKQILNPASLLLTFRRVRDIYKLKEKGKSAFNDGDYAGATCAYTEALGMCKDSKILQALFLSNICACEQATGRYVDALASASTACILAPSYAKAHSRLGAIYTELDMVSDAKATYESLLKMSLTADERAKVQSYLKTVSERANAGTPIDLRRLLGVGAKPSNDELKKCYRQLALSHHPDKATRGGASQALSNARADVSSRLFNLISEAYNVLSDCTAAVKWENARVKAKNKTFTSNESPSRRSPFSDSNASRTERYY